LTSWHDGEVLAVHNVANRSARARLRLPNPGERGRWHHLLAPKGRRAPAIESRDVALELAPYEYHWFGRRGRL
jgi:hypothetical protein